MSLSLFWKSLVFWIAVLFALSIATALVPGSEKWPAAVPFVLILAIALCNLWFIKRKQRENPEAYKTSPRGRRNYMIANVAFSAFLALGTYLIQPNDPWHIGIALIWSVAAIVSAYRLVNELRRQGT